MREDPDVVLIGEMRDNETFEAAIRAAETGQSEPEVEQQMADANSARTIIDASDIAYVVAMLASPLSIAINGDGIAAGGGVGTAIYY